MASTVSQFSVHSDLSVTVFSVTFDGRQAQVPILEFLYFLCSLMKVCVDWNFVEISFIA